VEVIAKAAADEEGVAEGEPEPGTGDDVWSRSRL
jgi:hypothetical protein